MPKNKCSLPKFKIKEVISAQEAKQKAGWWITAFDLPKIWKLSQGEGVKIAILDSGIATHDDLKNNVLDGINFVQKNKKPIDDCGHGSSCAGIICANNNDVGIVGVAPKAQIIPVKVLDQDGSGEMADVAKGIRWAADNGANLICMSLGSPKPLQNVRKAIQYADAKGVVVFVAAGNAGMTENIYYPSRYPETISVGSIDENFKRSKFSNTGDNLDFMAPGSNILTTTLDNWYGVMNGTSAACPFVVGIAALLLSYNNKHKEFKLNCADDYRRILKQGTIPITDKKYSGKKFFQGFGIIDPRKFEDWLRT